MTYTVLQWLTNGLSYIGHSEFKPRAAIVLTSATPCIAFASLAIADDPKQTCWVGKIIYREPFALRLASTYPRQ